MLRRSVSVLLAARQPARSLSGGSAPPLYTASAHTVGGRNGNSASSDGNLKVQLSVPKGMGGPGGSGTNPEQLFASGYSACFLGAMGLAAKNLHLQLPADTSIDAQVRLSKDLNIAVTFDINGASDKEVMKRIVEEAHKLCPYSKATRGNIDVQLNVK